MNLHPAIIAHLSAQDAGLPLATCDALAALELDHGASCDPRPTTPTERATGIVGGEDQ